MRRLALVEALLATMLAMLPTVACATPRYAVAERYPLPADEGWDDLSIDAARHHLFITRSTHVQVLDLPGTYSLTPTSADEQVTLEVIEGRRGGE